MRRDTIHFYSAFAAYFLLVSWQGTAWGAATAHTDAEIALRLDGITQSGTTNPATLDVFGAGSRQVGPITPAVFDAFNRVRISGVTNPTAPVAMTAAPFPSGSQLELDSQVGVETDTLSLGQSAELLITLTGTVDIANHNAFDATMNIFYEREFFLRTTINNPAAEQALSHGTFHILGKSFDSTGTIVDQFSRDFDQAQAVEDFANPEEKFNFNFVIPAGGTGRFDMTATAYSRVAVVPEPAGFVLIAFGMGALATARRQRRT
jgi:hypothetical protein